MVNHGEPPNSPGATGPRTSSQAVEAPFPEVEPWPPLPPPEEEAAAAAPWPPLPPGSPPKATREEPSALEPWEFHIAGISWDFLGFMASWFHLEKLGEIGGFQSLRPSVFN